MSITRVKDLKTAKEMVRNEKDYAALLDRRDPLIAFAILESPGARINLEEIQSFWVNHEGKLIPGTLIRQAIEIATFEMTYEEIIKLFLNLNMRNSVSPFTGPFILKRIITDPDFSAALQKDNVLAPILFHINPDAAAMMPDGFVKPIGEASKDFMRTDKITSANFDPNHMTPFEEDIIAIQTLLADKESMLQQLDTLEAELNAAIKKLNPSAKFPLEPLIEDNYRLFTKPYPKDSEKSFLFEFFRTWAMSNKFLGMTRLTNMQSDQQFVANLVEGIPFKDTEFDGKYHGAWTHLIQWYCIVNAYKNGQLHLNHSPAILFQEIGKNAGENNEIWGNTFEAPTTKINIRQDFRDVEFFNRFLIQDVKFAQRCPTIQAMLYSRALKADEKQKNTAKQFKT